MLCNSTTPPPTHTHTHTRQAVLDLLKEYGAHATFFNIANQARNPLAGRVLADGHVIGSHTYNDFDMILTRLLSLGPANTTITRPPPSNHGNHKTSNLCDESYMACDAVCRGTEQPWWNAQI